VKKNVRRKTKVDGQEGLETMWFRNTSLPASAETYRRYLAIKGLPESTLRVRFVHPNMFLAWCQGKRILRPIQVTKAVLEMYQRYLCLYRKKNKQSLAFASQHACICKYPSAAHRNLQG